VERDRVDDTWGLLRDVQRRVAHHDDLLGLLLAPPHEVAQLLEAARGTAEYEAAYAVDALVSVRITTYAGLDDLIDRAIPSLQAQTHENWEAVVVGDAVGEATGRAIAQLDEPRVRFHDLPFRGPYPDDPRDLWHTAGARPFNVATELSRGAWLGKLDQDDMLEPDALEVLLAHAVASRAEVVYGTARLVRADESAAPIGELGAFPPRRGDFALTASLVHASLRSYRLSELSWLWDEPGDWAYAHRLWLGGATFGFLETAVARVFVAPKPVRGGLDVALEEMRSYLTQVEEARDFYRDQVQKLTDARDYWQGRAEGQAQ
jgi:hypothetical protein